MADQKRCAFFDRDILYLLTPTGSDCPISRNLRGTTPSDLTRRLDLYRCKNRYVCSAPLRTSGLHHFSGDIVNIIGHFERIYTAAPNAIQSIITLSTSKNILILHPDILITVTSISNSAQCARRPLIGALLSSTSNVTPSLVWGNMLHEIMQACLAHGRWDARFIDDQTNLASQRPCARHACIISC